LFIQKHTGPGGVPTPDLYNIRIHWQKAIPDIIMGQFPLPDGVKIFQRNGTLLNQPPIFVVEGGAAFFTAGSAALTL
jgi:hypothetical protein